MFLNKSEVVRLRSCLKDVRSQGEGVFSADILQTRGKGNL